MTPRRWALAACGLVLLALAAQLLPPSAPTDVYLPRLGIPVEIPGEAAGAPGEAATEPLELELPAGSYRLIPEEPAGGLPVQQPRLQGPVACDATPRDGGWDLRLPVRVRGLRLERSPPRGEPVQTRLVPLRRDPGMGLPAPLRKGRHQIPLVGSGGRPELWMYLDGGGAYDFEDGGFWLREGGEARLLLLAATPLPALELRLHALTEVAVTLPEGPVVVGPDRTERILLTPRLVARKGDLHLYEISLGCRGGRRPDQPEDRRILGAFCRLPRERDALWMADRLLAAGRMEEARAELAVSDLPEAQVALLSLEPGAAAPFEPGEGPWSRALLWAQARRTRLLGGPVEARSLAEQLETEASSRRPPEPASAYPELAVLLRQPGDLALRDGLDLLRGEEPQPAEPLAAFGSLHIVAARVRPDPAAPGSAAELELELRRGEEPPPDLLLRIHAVPGGGGRPGHLWSRFLARLLGRPRLVVADHRPTLGVGPPAVWIPGETVLDRSTLHLPADAPSGEQTVLVSAVRRRDGGEVPDGLTGATWVRVAGFRVQPLD